MPMLAYFQSKLSKAVGNSKFQADRWMQPYSTGKAARLAKLKRLLW